VRCDVSKGASVEAAIQQTLSAFNALHAIHNNAGIVRPSKPLHETSEEEWDLL
jgi:NAD(P)-dependent dehydrogenase (short-subunit alcohol dehydrogenase family)